MKKMLLLTCIILLGASPCNAEHKLLVTDVLDSKEVEAEASFAYGHGSVDFTLLGSPGTQTRNVLSSAYGIGIGIGSGIELSLGIPYAFKDKVETYFSSFDISMYTRKDGLGDPVIGLKYRLYENRNISATVVAGLYFKPYAADKRKAGTGTNDVAPFLAVSTIYGPNLKPFASYQAVIRDHGAEDSHSVSAGVEYAMGPTVTFTPHLSATFRTASDTLKPYQTYDIGLSSYIKAQPNFYVIPFLSAGINTSTSTRDGNIDYDEMTFYQAGFALYYLFK